VSQWIQSINSEMSECKKDYKAAFVIQPFHKGSKKILNSTKEKNKLQAKNLVLIYLIFVKSINLVNGLDS